MNGGIARGVVNLDPGPFGAEEFLAPNTPIPGVLNDSIPLEGGQKVTMWESSLARAPVFYHGNAARRTDFLLVRCKDKVAWSDSSDPQPAAMR